MAGNFSHALWAFMCLFLLQGLTWTTTTMANLGDQEPASAYKSVFDPHTCTRRGMCPVTELRYPVTEPLQRHSLYFEVHGSGPQKIVFIMGLNTSSFAWQAQVDHFGKLEQYTTLVFDNRGVGMSGSPMGPYSSLGMAKDLIYLLDYLQWTEDRTLHIVGISLGGMIAQELAYRIPSRIVSLSLVVTRAGGGILANMPPLSGCLRFARSLNLVQFIRIPIAMEMLFPSEWLDSAAEGDPLGRTNRQVQWEILLRRIKIARPQTLTGALGQMAACLTHRMEPERLATLSATIPKVLILSAVEDALVSYTEGENLKRYMPEAEYQCWEKTGHGICGQYKERFNRLLEKVFEQGKEAVGKRSRLSL